MPNFYEGTDAKLVTDSASFSTLITGAPTTYGLVAAQATAYAALNTAYGTAYSTAKEPATRTSVTVAAKNAARLALVTNAKMLGNIIRSTPTVTNAQLLSLGLSNRAAPLPIPPPSSAPALEIASVSSFTVKIKLHDSTSSSTRGKPAGVSGASVFSFVGATAPLDLTEWQFEGNTGKTKIDVIFPSSVAAGAKVWITAFWFNGRKQSGPACAPVSTNVQGGGVSMAA